jgi:NADH dehydrogenase FAD-containing subunit
MSGGRHLVLVGGGHAHLAVLASVDQYVGRGHRVTLVTPSDYTYYSGMAPGMLAGTYRPQQVRFNVRRMAEGGGAGFVRDRAVRLEPDQRLLHLAVGAPIGYDVISFNIGSLVCAGDLVGAGCESVLPAKPVENFLRLREAFLARARGGEVKALVVGGGASGVEAAGGLWRLALDNRLRADITLVSGGRLLQGLPARARRIAMASLARRTVRVIEESPVRSLRDGVAVLADGSRMGCDVGLTAVGVRPAPIFGPSGMPTGPNGGLLVNDCLQSVAHTDVFGAGDCISMQGRSLARIGVHAVRQAPVLRRNLMAALEGRALCAYRPRRSHVLILNLGDGTGMLHRGRWVWHGRPVLLLKDRIDRRFMRRFQVSGELLEPLGGGH